MNKEPQEMKVPTAPFDIGFADTQCALDLNDDLPNCVYTPGTKQADEWWLGRQAAIDNHQLEQLAVNSVGYRLFSALVDTIVFRFFTLCIFAISLYVWITYREDMHFLIQTLIVYLILDPAIRLFDHFITCYTNEKDS